MSPLLNRVNLSSTYGSKVAALRRQANASSGGGGYSGPSGDAIFVSGGGQTWTCPAGVTSARVVVIGGGGGAGTGCGGGGGGASMKFYTNLVPGTAYNLDVASGGGRNASSGGTGGTSYFQGPGQTITASGGAGGTSASSPGQNERSAGGQGTGGDINGTGGKGFPSADNPIGVWGFNLIDLEAHGTNGGAGGGGFGADNYDCGHGGRGSMYAGGGGGGGGDNGIGGCGGPGGELTISDDGTGAQRAMGGGGGGTDGTHLPGGTIGGLGGAYGGNQGQAQDTAHGGAGGSYAAGSGGEGGHGAGQQAGGGGGGSFGGGGGAGRYGSTYGGGAADGLVYIRWGLDRDGTPVGAHYPIASTFNGRMDLMYHTWEFNMQSTAQVKAPGGIEEGDLLIIMEYGDNISSPFNGNTPSGFVTVLPMGQNASADHRMHYKVADGTEGNQTFYGQTGGSQTNNCHMFTFRGNVPLTSVALNNAVNVSNSGNPSPNLGVNQYNGYAMTFMSAACANVNVLEDSNNVPATGWTKYPNLDGKSSQGAEWFGWRVDNPTAGNLVTREISWAFNGGSPTAIAMALNLDFTPPPAGQALFTGAGNAATWTCPTGVTKVSVVCIGGGGGWTAGTASTFEVPAASVSMSAGGGTRNSPTPGVSSGGDQNWSGGAGGSSSYGSGGGGAAGYSGDGCNGGGGSGMFAATYVAGTGGGAGGGSYTGHQNGDSVGQPRGGGGTGIMGKGADATFWAKGGSGGGDAVSHNGSETYGGGGGVTGQYGTRSGGGGGLCWKNNIPVVPGTTYNMNIGGGGNGGSEVGAGGHGAVRIIWGYNRSFPNNNTGDV